MSADGMAIAIASGAVRALCEAIDCCSLDGGVEIDRKDGTTVKLTGEEVQKVIIGTLAAITAQMISSYEENDDA